MLKDINKPSYYMSGLVEKMPEKRNLTLSQASFKRKVMYETCGMAAYLRQQGGAMVQVGTTTEEINRKLHDIAMELKFYPAALDYKGFPKSVSTSVNEVACHGIPDNRPLENGDLVKLDCFSYYMGHYGDCCGTFIAGAKTAEGEHLVEATKECVKKAVSVCGDGAPLSEIGAIIEFIFILLYFMILLGWFYNDFTMILQ